MGNRFDVQTHRQPQDIGVAWHCNGHTPRKPVRIFLYLLSRASTLLQYKVLDKLVTTEAFRGKLKGKDPQVSPHEQPRVGLVMLCTLEERSNVLLRNSLQVELVHSPDFEAGLISRVS